MIKQTVLSFKLEETKDLITPHAGLALATSLAAWVNAGLLYRALVRKNIYRPAHGWLRLLAQAGLAGTALAVLLALAVPGLTDWLAWGASQRITQLLLWVLAGVVVYFSVLRLSGLRLLETWRQGRLWHGIDSGSL